MVVIVFLPQITLAVVFPQSVPKLSVIVPVFNEAHHLSHVLDKLMASPSILRREWIFVNDGSTDSSIEILKSFPFTEDFKVVELVRNSGKGAAIAAALQHVEGDFVMIQDADFEYEPSEVPNLLEPLLSNRADVVYGTRFRDGRKNALLLSYFANRFLTSFHNVLCGSNLTDVETCYKVFKSDVVQNMRLRSQRFGVELELTAYLAKLNVRVLELPISYSPRTRKQGKKITWKDGMAGIFHLIRFNILTSRRDAFRAIPAHYAKTSEHQ